MSDTSHKGSGTLQNEDLISQTTLHQIFRVKLAIEWIYVAVTKLSVISQNVHVVFVFCFFGEK